jgi:hypothetical protein
MDWRNGWNGFLCPVAADISKPRRAIRPRSPPRPCLHALKPEEFEDEKENESPIPGYRNIPDKITVTVLFEPLWQPVKEAGATRVFDWVLQNQGI